jgi:hypothetical protein
VSWGLRRPAHRTAIRVLGSPLVNKLLFSGITVFETPALDLRFFGFPLALPQKSKQ